MSAQKGAALKRAGFISNMRRDIRTNYNLYLMIMPAFVLFILFCYLPMYGIIIAFKKYDIVLGFDNSPWVGLKYFESFFKDPFVGRLIRNTFVLGFMNLFWGFWPPILLALLLSEMPGLGYRKFVQSVSYLPHFVSTVVIVGMLMDLFGATGLINRFRESLNMETIAFFNKPEYFRSLYIGSGIWQGVGWGSIIYMSALSGVDAELYEAAYIDGASRIKRIIHISLPSILPVITILLILNAANIVNVGFEKVYLMQNPAIYETADVISTYVYRRGLVNRNFSFGTAVGLMNSIISFVIVFATNRISRALDGATLW